MPREADRVSELSTSTGTGLMTLAGATLGHRTWAAAFGGSNIVVHYGIVHDGNGTWEVGIGTFLPGSNALQRDLALSSSSGVSKVSFASGSKIVYCQQPAEGALQVRVRQSTTVGVDVIPAASQSASMIRVQTAGGGDAFTVSPTGRITSIGGLDLGSGVAPGGVHDLSRHVSLHGSGYGFNVTSSRLNYNVNAGAAHDFYVDTGRVARISATGIDATLKHAQSGGYFRIGAYDTGSQGTGDARFHYDANQRELNIISDNAGSTGDLTIRTGTIMLSGGGSVSAPAIRFQSDSNSGFINVSENVLGFVTGGALQAKLGSDSLHYMGDRLLVGSSGYTGLSAGAVGINLQGPIAGTPGAYSGTVSGAACIFINRLASNGNIVEFYRQSSFIAAISITTGAVTYNTTSDARRKKNARDFDSGALLDALHMVEFDWKAEYGGGAAFGTLVDAETAAIIPTAFTRDEDHDVWQADYSKLVPILWREVRDLRVRLAELEGV